MNKSLMFCTIGLLLTLFLSSILSPAFAQDTSTAGTYKNARSYFYDGEFSKAKPLLESLISNTSDSNIRRRANYFLGRILEEQQKLPIKALKHFDRVLQGPINYLTDDALFFIATILNDQMNQNEMALPYLKTLITHFQDGDYYDEAKEKYNSLTKGRDRPVTAYEKTDIPPPRVQLNFEKVDLKDFISAYSKMSSKNFIYKPNVSGKVTIIAPQGFPIYNLFDVFLNVLETRNYTAIQKDDHLVIKSIKEAFRDGISRETVQTGLQTKLFDLQGLPWGNVKQAVKTILPRRKNIFQLNKFDQMMVTTTPDKISQIENLLKKLRSINRGTIITFEPDHARVGRLSNRLKSFLKDIIDQNSFKLITLKNNNTLIVRAPSERKDMILRMLRKFDGNIIDRLNIRVINLNHADAKNVTNKMQQLTNVLPGNFKNQNIEIVPSRRQNAVIVSSTSRKAITIIEDAVHNLDKPSPQQPKEVRVFKVEHMTPKEMSKQLNQLSNLLPGDFPNKNIKIVPSKQQQAVVVSASNKNTFSTIKNIIDRLDRKNKNAPDSIRVFQLENADEQAVAKKLRKLTKTLPGPVSQDDLTILPDKRQQAVVISAESVKTIKMLKRVINEIDTATKEGSSNFHVYKVHNAKAGPLAEKLNFLVKNQAGEQINITADEQSNSLVISAPTEKFETLKPIIHRLDSSKKQILVDVYIVEASRDNVKRLGVEWTASGEVNDRRVSGGTNYGLRPQFQQGSLLGLSSGIFDESGDDLIGMLSAFSERSGFKILSTSHLVANENEEANLSVGSIVPILESVQTTDDNTQNRSFSFENVGVELTMVPTLSGDSEVTLSLDQKIQEIQSTGQELGAPTRRTREINTRLSITQNRTLVLGGVMSSQKNLNRQSVPYLAEIPGLNYLFSNINNQKERRNLLIFIQPHILGDKGDAREMTEELRNKQELRLDSDTGVTLDNLQQMMKEKDTASSDTLPENQSDP